MTVRSHLSRHIGRKPWNDEEIRSMAKKLWLEKGIAVLWPDDHASYDRELIHTIANQTYGTRHG